MTDLRKFASLALAAAALSFSVPVQAYTVEELNCIEREADDGIADKVMDALFHDAGLIEEEPQQPLAPFFAVATLCAYQMDLPDALMADFGSYTLTTIAGEEARNRLIGLGVDMDMVDARLGIDWRNPDAPAFVISDEIKNIASDLMTSEIERLDIGYRDQVHALLYIGFYMAMVQGWSEAIVPLTA